MKYFGLIITVSFVLTLGGYLLLDHSQVRKVASDTLKTDTLKNVELTASQKLKWSVTEQFNIRQTNESLLIDIPHITELCEENQNLIFKFSAYEVAVASESPQIQYFVSCFKAKAQQQQPLTHFEILFSDLISLHANHEKTLTYGKIKSYLVFSDEPFALRWNLSEITVEGYAGFKINKYEIQKVFGNNFEFELVK
jgi:hypothetical protein